MYISALGELGGRRGARRAGARGAVRGAVRRATRAARAVAPVAAGFVPGAGGVLATQVADRAQRRGARRPGRAQVAPPDVAQQAEAVRRAEVARWVDVAQRAEIPRRPRRPRQPRQPAAPGLPVDVRPAAPGLQLPRPPAVAPSPAVPDFWQRAQPVIDAATGVYVAREQARAEGRAITALPRARDTVLERFGDEGGPWGLLPPGAPAPGLRAPGAPPRGLLPEHQQVHPADDADTVGTAPGITPTTMLLIGGIALVAFLAMK